jgi:hypothetical protein
VSLEDRPLTNLQFCIARALGQPLESFRPLSEGETAAAPDAPTVVAIRSPSRSTPRESEKVYRLDRQERKMTLRALGIRGGK